jgi:hypothetical protein
MSFEYITKINNKDISNLQLSRASLKQEVDFVSSYNLNFNSVDFTIPFNQAGALYDITPLNNVALFDTSGNQVFAGYITAKEEINAQNTIKATATGYLNQLSKKYFTISDTGYVSARAYLIQMFQKNLIPALPYAYPINTHMINDSLLNNIALYQNSGTSSVTGMSSVIDLMTVLNTSAYLENGVIKFAAFPESWPDINSVVDIAPYLKQPLDAKEQYQYYYDTISLDYLNASNGTKKNITYGPGGLVKKPSLNNLYIDDTSANNLVHRFSNIYNKIYSTVEFECRRDIDLNLCQFVGYKNPAYRNYVFFITSLENKYTSWAVKAMGIKI